MSLELEKIGSEGIGKRPKDFPKLYDDNLDTLVAKFVEVDAELSSQGGESSDLGDRVSANELSITNLLSRMSLSENDIELLQTQLPSISASLSAAIGLNAADIAVLQIQVGDIIDTLVLSGSGSLQAQIDYLEEDVENVREQVDTLQSSIDGIALSGSSTIGAAEDGSYLDGLYPDFTPSTLIGTAIDRFNVVLKSLSPPSPPSISSISINSGVNGNLSFGTSNDIGYENHPTINVNGPFNNSGNDKGIFNGITNITGTLADNTDANLPSYPANSFSNGDQGNLILEVNGVEIFSEDLETFSSGTTVDVDGSGFNLSASIPISYQNGDPFPDSKYRTGTYVVHRNSQRDGYNKVRVIHRISSDIVTQTFAWINDSDGTGTSFSNSMANVNMTGLNYLSGVKYYSGGTADYNLNIENAYRNTYSQGNLTFSETNIVNVTNTPLLNIGGGEDESKSHVSIIPVTINATKIIGGSASVKVTVPRTVQPTIQSGNTSITNILLDDSMNPGTSTLLSESFDDENYRVSSSMTGDLSFVDYATVPTYDYDSTEDLNGSTSLQVIDGALKWPSGNYAYTNGPTSNVDYSGITTGSRTFFRWFSFGVGSNVDSIILDINSDNTNFVNTLSPLTGDNAFLELLLPNETTVATSLSFKDGYQGFLDPESVGCYADNIPVTGDQRGYTFGIRTTFKSKGVVVVKITVSNSWSGQINGITMQSYP